MDSLRFAAVDGPFYNIKEGTAKMWLFSVLSLSMSGLGLAWPLWVKRLV